LFAFFADKLKIERWCILKTVITQIVTIEKKGNIADLIEEMPNDSRAEMVLVEGEKAQNYCLFGKIILILTTSGKLLAFGKYKDKSYDGDVLMQSLVRGSDSQLKFEEGNIVLIPNSKKPKEKILYSFGNPNDAEHSELNINSFELSSLLPNESNTLPRIVLAVEKNNNNCTSSYFP